MSSRNTLSKLSTAKLQLKAAALGATNDLSEMNRPQLIQIIMELEEAHNLMEAQIEEVGEEAQASFEADMIEGADEVVTETASEEDALSFSYDFKSMKNSRAIIRRHIARLLDAEATQTSATLHFSHTYGGFKFSITRTADDLLFQTIIKNADGKDEFITVPQVKMYHMLKNVMSGNKATSPATTTDKDANLFEAEQIEVDSYDNE